MAEPARLLIVDDNHAAADGLARLLRAIGHAAHAVYSGEDARVHIESNPVDLAFIDIGMPDMNGNELVALLRSDGFDSPTIALTGYGLDEDKQASMKAGFTDHLTKPVGIKEIRESLAKHLFV